MTKYIKFTFPIIILFFFISCSSVKEAFDSQRKNSSDEFLVEKKKPLSFPPNYEKLPIPGSENSIDTKVSNPDEVKKLLINTKNVSKDKKKINQNLENQILEKINEIN